MGLSEGYPVSVNAELSFGLSRWQWLVKWLLALPHLVVVTLLSLPLLVLIPIAWFAILIGGRYPRFIFDYNLGLMRWSWRVSCYA